MLCVFVLDWGLHTPSHFILKEKIRHRHVYPHVALSFLQNYKNISTLYMNKNCIKHWWRCRCRQRQTKNLQWIHMNESARDSTITIRRKLYGSFHNVAHTFRSKSSVKERQQPQIGSPFMNQLCLFWNSSQILLFYHMHVRS